MSAPLGAEAADAGPLSAAKLEALAELCRRFHVKNLDLFGSATTGRFDPARSDLDFLVEFERPAAGEQVDWFGFEQQLQALFGRAVDVLTRLPPNPYVRRSIEATKRRVFPVPEPADPTSIDPKMSEKKPAAYLWNALEAATRIERFTADRSFQDYLADEMLRAAVERQFGIIGDAMSRIKRIDPVLATKIPDLQKIIAFRNIVVHEYYDLKHEKVWESIQHGLPRLRTLLERLLAEVGGP